MYCIIFCSVYVLSELLVSSSPALAAPSLDVARPPSPLEADIFNTAGRQYYSALSKHWFMISVTVDNNITLTFRFYETTVERKNSFRCTDRRTVEKRNDKYCTMILERFGGCVQG